MRWLPESPPPRTVTPKRLVVPPGEAAAKSPRKGPSTPLGPKVPEEASTLFYVRTLTPNDVSKAHKKTPGTWEPDLGLTARNEHPDFWGWPTSYTQVSADRQEWRIKALYRSRTLTQGLLSELCIWFRPERPGHPAEHRFRPASAGPRPGRYRPSLIPPRSWSCSG